MTLPRGPSSTRNETSGRFIVFEGPEGSGKSTQISRLAERLRSLGRDPLLTREPGGTPAGEAVRSVLLDPRYHIAPLAEFLLYAACRAQHVEDVIAPALAAGRDVVSDRFGGASVAYQGYGRGLDLELIHDVNLRATAGLRPDLTLLLDLDPADGLRRAEARAGHDRLEAESLAFHLRVREGFLEQARHDRTWQVIDASGSEETVAAAVWETVATLLSAEPKEARP
ncbi:MAG: dTMP kinase [Trueperaceae bacterium]